MTTLKLVREDGTPARIEDLCDSFGPSIEIDGVRTHLVEYRGPSGLDSRETNEMVLKLRWHNRTTSYVNRGTGCPEEVEWSAFADARRSRIAQGVERGASSIGDLVEGRHGNRFRKFGRRR